MAVFEQLRKLLDESVQDGEQRVRSYLDSIYSTGLQVILYGAGNVGRKTASILQEDSRPVACFADNNASLWGTAINGIEVMSPEEAVKRYADMGAFMVTAFNREFHADYRDIHNKLKNFGAKHIYPYPVLAWKYPDQLLPPPMSCRTATKY